MRLERFLLQGVSDLAVISLVSPSPLEAAIIADMPPFYIWDDKHLDGSTMDWDEE